jgi:hypothetical protein
LLVFQTRIITIYDSKKRKRNSCTPDKVHRRPVGGGNRALGVAAGDHVVGAFGTSAALVGHTQLELDVIKAQALAGQLGNGFVAYAVADTNNHGGWGVGLRVGVNVL